ncbi:hypothetical protein LDENG_00280040 [Lucifuga dentata]|nr:hypothetical protein LDENG_00280040 [Lucifuga dentata]
MDDELNVTYLTFAGHVQIHKYRFLYFTIMFTVYILIICSNSTIVCLISIHKNLHEPMYIFIAALLVNSVVFSTAIYPKLLIDFLSEKQIISYPACLGQFFMYYTFAASEFLLLSAMAYDRYVSICKPLQYPAIMTKTTVSILLLLAWLWPACHGVVSISLKFTKKLCHFTLKGIFCNNALNELACVSSTVVTAYGVIALINCVLFPMLFILFTYTRIFIITYQSSRDVRKKAAQTCLPHLLVLISISLLSTYDIVIIRVESYLTKTTRLIMTLQALLYHPLFNPIIYGLKMKEISKHRHVQMHKYRFLYFTIMFTVYILIICSNSTIVYLIWIHKNLHEPMYIFIAALLLNSILFSTAIYPKLLIDFLSEKQIISYPACLCQFFMYYTFAAAEFLLLSAMAYDRYVSICKPLQYPTIMTKTTVSILLLLAWLWPACHVVVSISLHISKKLCSFTLKGVFCNNAFHELTCVLSKVVSVYGMIALINCVLFPTLFIVFTYTRILIITYQSSRDVRKKAAQTCLPHLLVLISISLLSTYDIVIIRVESYLTKTTRLIMTLQALLYHPLFNPIIYGLKMKEISKHLKRLFCQAKLI